MASNTILGLSGRKQCGKNTTANFILGLMMTSMQIVKGQFVINPQGKLWISDIFNNTDFEGVFDIERDNATVKDFKANYLDDYIRFYSFADLLKQEVCMKVLGLTKEQCYGSDEEKNSPTQYKWENMPGVTTIQTPQSPVSSSDAKALREYYKEIVNGMMYHAPGPMTAREVMQYVGTDIFRKMHNNVWVDACIRRIEKDKSCISIITDLRFPNEVKGIQDAGGKVLRLTRNPTGDSDVHASETALDKENFDWDNFDFVVDNHESTIPSHCEMIYEALKDEKWFPEVVELPQETK